MLVNNPKAANLCAVSNPTSRFKPVLVRQNLMGLPPHTPFKWKNKALHARPPLWAPPAKRRRKAVNAVSNRLNWKPSPAFPFLFAGVKGAVFLFSFGSKRKRKRAPLIYWIGNYQLGKLKALNRKFGSFKRLFIAKKLPFLQKWLQCLVFQVFTLYLYNGNNRKLKNNRWGF